jgi:chemotaxis signal transduction protein
MLRGWNANQNKQRTRSLHLLIFSVGGRKLAVRTDELAGVRKWTEGIPVAGATPFISSVVHPDQAVPSVFDLAELLHVSVRGDAPMWVMAKHPRGILAICVDEEMPILHSLDAAAVQPYHGKEFPSIGSFSCEHGHIPILSILQLEIPTELNCVRTEG